MGDIQSQQIINLLGTSGYLSVLMCWCVDDLCWCVDVLMTFMCWCADVLMCWCVDVLMLMCWCVDVLICWCADVLMCWCVDVLMCWCVDDCVTCSCGDVLMWWCVDVLICWCVGVDVLMCWCVEVVMLMMRSAKTKAKAKAQNIIIINKNSPKSKLQQSENVAFVEEFIPPNTNKWGPIFAVRWEALPGGLSTIRPPCGMISLHSSVPKIQYHQHLNVKSVQSRLSNEPNFHRKMVF